jgi:stage V sporulation protein G
MKITDVRVRVKEAKDDKETKVKAIVSVTFDACFVVHDIKVLEGKEGLFVSMPRKQFSTGEFKDIAHPLNSEFREEIKTAVLGAYEKALTEAPAEE